LTGNFAPDLRMRALRWMRRCARGRMWSKRRSPTPASRRCGTGRAAPLRSA